MAAHNAYQSVHGKHRPAIDGATANSCAKRRREGIVCVVFVTPRESRTVQSNIDD